MDSNLEELDVASLGGGWRPVRPKLDRGVMGRRERAGSRASQGWMKERGVWEASGFLE